MDRQGRSNKWRVNSKAGLVLLACLLCASAFRFVWSSSALGQEKDTMPILLAAAKMAKDGTDIEEVGTSQKRWLAQDFDAVTRMMKHKGWSFTEQAGSVVIYNKGKSTLQIKGRPYTKRYVICQADTVP